jgi:hypothetical protein
MQTSLSASKQTVKIDPIHVCTHANFGEPKLKSGKPMRATKHCLNNESIYSICGEREREKREEMLKKPIYYSVPLGNLAGRPRLR